MARVKVGDVVRVGEFDGLLVVAHYVFADPDHGPFVQFYRCRLDWGLDQGLGDCEKLYTPILVGIGAATKSGGWTILGYVAPSPFRYPQFLMDSGGSTWYLFDGRKEKWLKKGVPVELQGLETLSVWPAELIEERIRTGVNPVSYEASSGWSVPKRDKT